MSLKIEDLKHQMVNVAIRGKARGKSQLNDLKQKNGKYFSFYLSDAPNSQIRIVAFKDAAEKFFSLIDNGKFYEIAKVGVKLSSYKGNSQLEITLTTNAVITVMQNHEIPDDNNRVFTPISQVINLNPHNSVDIIARVETFFETERILKNGDTREVCIVTLRDESAYIDATFWSHIDDIKNLSPDEKTVLLIENAKVNLYQGGHTLNVNDSSTITINLTYTTVDTLRELIDVSINLSQMSDASTIADQCEYPKSTLISAIKRSLQSIDEKEEKLKIKKYLLTQQLKHYEAQQ